MRRSLIEALNPGNLQPVVIMASWSSMMTLQRFKLA
jgi:hypothetical protein